jgi:hypothetical protein
MRRQMVRTRRIPLMGCLVVRAKRSVEKKAEKAAFALLSKVGCGGL